MPCSFCWFGRRIVAVAVSLWRIEDCPFCDEDGILYEYGGEG